MNKKKVLIIHATAGSGHTKAGEAVYKAFGELPHDFEVKIINSLDYMSAFFKYNYPRVYVFLVNRITIIWGFFYYFLDNRFFYPLVSWTRHITNWINSLGLQKFLVRYQPDLIISTHFLAPDVISIMGKSRVPAHLVSIITDYRPHSFWIVGGVDTYVVAYDETKQELIKRGVTPQKIKVLGMPIDPIFSKHIDRGIIHRRHEIEEGKFNVLIGSGGFGIGPVERLVKEILNIDIPIQLLVVCGKNEELYSKISQLKKEAAFPIKSLGFIDYMHELMEISDLIVTKSGGMVCAEALSKDLPIIAISPIPGQESRNIGVLIKKGVARKLKNISDIKGLLIGFYRDKDNLGSVREKIKDIKRPYAARDIAKLAKDILER